MAGSEEKRHEKSIKKAPRNFRGAFFRWSRKPDSNRHIDSTVLSFILPLLPDNPTDSGEILVTEPPGHGGLVDFIDGCGCKERLPDFFSQL